MSGMDRSTSPENYIGFDTVNNNTGSYFDTRLNQPKHKFNLRAIKKLTCKELSGRTVRLNYSRKRMELVPPTVNETRKRMELIPLTIDSYTL